MYRYCGFLGRLAVEAVSQFPDCSHVACFSSRYMRSGNATQGFVIVACFCKLHAQGFTIGFIAWPGFSCRVRHRFVGYVIERPPIWPSLISVV